MRGDARPRHPPTRGAPPCAVPGGRRGASPEGASSAGTLRGGVRGSGVYGVAQGKGGARSGGGTRRPDRMRSVSRPRLMDEMERGCAEGGSALEGPPAAARSAGSFLLLGCGVWGGSAGVGTPRKGIAWLRACFSQLHIICKLLKLPSLGAGELLSTAFCLPLGEKQMGAARSHEDGSVAVG